MAIFFAFSDESGNYKQNRNHRFNLLNPYYIRASFIMDGEDWHYLDSIFWDLKREYSIPQTIEVKYSDLWTLQQYHNHPQREVDTRLRNIIDQPIERLIEFIESAVALLNTLNNPQIIVTISKNDMFGTPEEKDVYTWHLQNLLQRIQMDLVSPDELSTDNLCLIFIDPINERINKILRESYNQLFVYGDRFTHFSTIKDCLHFELSHHSCGIQIADYIAGITQGYLLRRNYSIGIFNRQICPLLRKSNTGRIMGYGIIEIPSNPRIRTFLSDQFHVF